MRLWVGSGRSGRNLLLTVKTTRRSFVWSHQTPDEDFAPFLYGGSLLQATRTRASQVKRLLRPGTYIGHEPAINVSGATWRACLTFNSPLAQGPTSRSFHRGIVKRPSTKTKNLLCRSPSRGHKWGLFLSWAMINDWKLEATLLLISLRGAFTHLIHQSERYKRKGTGQAASPNNRSVLYYLQWAFVHK